MAAKSNFANMVIVLTVTCLICSALLAGVNALTAKPIAEANARNLKESLEKVLPEGSEISDGKPIEVGGQPSTYYEATKDGEVVAYAIKSVTTGFGGALTLMVGIQPDGVVVNTSVLDHSETPGLGAKCTTDQKFMSQWKGFDTNSKILSVKKDGGDVDAITASTITSRAYTLAVKNAAEALKTIGGKTND